LDNRIIDTHPHPVSHRLSVTTSWLVSVNRRQCGGSSATWGLLR